MSSKCWLTDPTLLLAYYDYTIQLYRLPAVYTFPLNSGRCGLYSNVDDYLSLIGYAFDWKKSDFDALADFTYRYDSLVNCQGLVFPLTFPRDRTTCNTPDLLRPIRHMSHDVLDMSRFGLPARSIPFRDVQYLESGGPASVDFNAKEIELLNQLEASNNERDREKAEKQALQIKVSELEEENSYLRSKGRIPNKKAI